jgi:hypothetical protein
LSYIAGHPEHVKASPLRLRIILTSSQTGLVLLLLPSSCEGTGTINDNSPKQTNKRYKVKPPNSSANREGDAARNHQIAAPTAKTIILDVLVSLLFMSLTRHHKHSHSLLVVNMQIPSAIVFGVYGIFLNEYDHYPNMLV